MSAERFGESETPQPGSAWSTSDIGATAGATMGNGRDSGGGQDTKDIAKEQARDVAREGVAGSKHVASVATDQVKEVASEAGHQAKSLLKDAKSELMEHAASQQNRVAEQLHALSAELGSMASKSEQEGPAADIARQASRQIGSLAHWVSQREPGSMVTELKGFARSKPGTFLAVAAGIGLAAGRMTRGVKAGAPEVESDTSLAYPYSPGTPGLGQRMTQSPRSDRQAVLPATTPAVTPTVMTPGVPPYPADPMGVDPIVSRPGGTTP